MAVASGRSSTKSLADAIATPFEIGKTPVWCQAHPGQNTVDRERFGAAQAAGKFKVEIVALELPGRKGPTVFDRDEHNRPDTTLDSLVRLKPAFRKDGTITAPRRG